MGSLPTIRNIETLLKNELGPNEFVLATKPSRLTLPGENFGSEMLSIVVHIKDKVTNGERTLQTAGKLIPESKEVQAVFDTQVTYKSEYQFYSVIGPLLDNFLKQNGFPEGADFIAPFYGGRLNLNGSECVDEDAIILMANLKSLGYETGNKAKGLDASNAEVALKSLAKFHAAGIGFKLQNPESFESDFRPYFYYFIGSNFHDSVFSNLIPVLESGEFSSEEIETVTSVYQGITKKKDISNTWGTLIHYDTWMNNILIKNKDSEPKNAVIVDYQVYEQGTPLNDVMLFLFTSIQLDILKKGIDHFLDFYYNCLIKNLERLGLDISKYSKDSFNEEVKIAVKKYEFHHTMWLLEPILNPNLNSLAKFKDGAVHLFNWTEEHKERIRFITRLCFEKGWF